MVSSSLSLSFFLSLLALWSFSFRGCLCKDQDVILPPIKNGPAVASLVLLHGASISPDQYIPTAQQIQQSSSLSLWVGIPTVDLNAPGAVPKAIDRIISEMQSQGMSTQFYFYGGHSLGTVKIQEYCFEYSSNCTGQVLLAGNLARNASGDYYYNKGYPVPTLTVGGELDGLTRITRMMEGYYHQVLLAPSSSAAIQDFPVVVLEGVTHMQFASGNPPLLVEMKDLNPEVTYDQAHFEIGQVVGSWVDVRVIGVKQAQVTLEKYLKQTNTLLQPLITAFTMESYYYFLIPCYEKYPDAKEGDDCCRQGGGCQCGNRWSPISQQIMGGLQNITYVDYDVMHPVSQVPVHLAHINNTCVTPDTSCVLEMNTVTENIYPNTIQGDNPFFPLAAIEMRTKLKSRQAVHVAAGIPAQDADFDTLDGPSRCADINQHVYQWAIDNAGSRTAVRFKQLGQKLYMGNDVMKTAGYDWITTEMTYTSATVNGEAVIVINSTALATPIDYFQKNSQGMHYCKVLSPAYASEWIYVDGLRLRDSLSSQ